MGDDGKHGGEGCEEAGERLGGTVASQLGGDESVENDDGEMGEETGKADSPKFGSED